VTLGAVSDDNLLGVLIIERSLMKLRLNGVRV
jgi:hypothetical protein